MECVECPVLRAQIIELQRELENKERTIQRMKQKIIHDQILGVKDWNP